MSKRAVSRCKDRNIRLDEVFEAVKNIARPRGKDFVTMRQVARYIGLVPSSHVLGMLKELYVTGRIDRKNTINSRGAYTHGWQLPGHYSQCRLPWEL